MTDLEIKTKTKPKKKKKHTHTHTHTHPPPTHKNTPKTVFEACLTVTKEVLSRWRGKSSPNLFNSFVTQLAIYGQKNTHIDN